MSMTTPFNPNHTLSNGLKVVVVEPDLGNINNPGYVMTLTVSDNDGDIAVLKQTPNEAVKVIFDVSEILRVTKPSQDRHLPDAITSNGGVRRIILQAKEVWEGGDNVIATETGFVIHGAQQFRDGLLYDEAANRDVFLSEFRNVKATDDDYGSAAVSPQLSGQLDFRVFDAQGSEIQTFDLPFAAVTSAETTRVQFLPLYPNSLKDLGITLNANWSSYTAKVGRDLFFSNSYIERVDDDGGDVFLSAAQIDERLFDIVCPIELFDSVTVTKQCDLPYEKYRLAFWNTRGGWDYFNFDLNHTERIEVERNEFTQLYGSWNADTFGYSKHERGRAVYESTTQELVTVSAKVTQDESEALKKLLGSREVQLLSGSQGEAINIVDTTFPVFHNLDRTRKTLTVTFQYANKLLNA